MSEGRPTMRRPRSWAFAAFAALAVTAGAQVEAIRAEPASGVVPAPGVPAGLFDLIPALPLDGPFLSSDGAWPERWGREGSRLQGVIVEERPRSLPEAGKVDAGEDRRFLSGADRSDVEALLAGRGGGGLTFQSEGANSFILRLPEEGAAGRALRRSGASMLLRFVSGRAEGDAGTVTIERTWFTVLEPTGGAPARGTALLMPGIFGTPEGVIDMFASRLRERGWVVLRMLAQPSRFTEAVAMPVDLDGDLVEDAAAIAEVVNQRSAECAYAVEASFAYLEEKRPELAALPRVALGASGGAITLPTVVARERDRYSAAVLVGGGAAFWLLNERSNYARWIGAFETVWTPREPTRDDLGRVAEAYLASAPLDAYHTAAALRGKPTLFIYGTSDRAVPTPLSEVLWSRLGEPERWVRDAGHELLFMQLTAILEDVMVWLDHAVPRDPAPASGERGVAPIPLPDGGR